VLFTPLLGEDISFAPSPKSAAHQLLNGEGQGQPVANQSEQFVAFPPKLLLGDYGLMLRSRQPDGGLATSKQSVMVAVDEVESSSGHPAAHGGVVADLQRP
jgi:hypothetical protein